MDIPEHLFTISFKSCERGICKPNPNIYQEFQNEAYINPTNILFIDDNANNLIEPKKLGWNIYLFDGNTKKLIDYINDFSK